MSQASCSFFQKKMEKYAKQKIHCNPNDVRNEGTLILFLLHFSPQNKMGMIGYIMFN